jgi:hypothetical protein
MGLTTIPVIIIIIIIISIIKRRRRRGKATLVTGRGGLTPWLARFPSRKIPCTHLYSILFWG